MNGEKGTINIKNLQDLVKQRGVKRRIQNDLVIRLSHWRRVWCHLWRSGKGKREQDSHTGSLDSDTRTGRKDGCIC